MAIRIGIIGVNGRMGRLIAEETRAAGADLAGGIGRPGGSAAAPPDVVNSRCFEDLYHELFNERDADPVFETLEHWLDQGF